MGMWYCGWSNSMWEALVALHGMMIRIVWIASSLFQASLAVIFGS